MLSIIAPTYNRIESLKKFLFSLDRLKNPRPVVFEVLIVDNGSVDGTVKFLNVEAARRSWLRVLRGDRPGESTAINCGLKVCRGEIICLLDDDVVVDPGWLEGLAVAYERTEFAAIQGRVLPGVDPMGKSADPEALFRYNIHVVDFGDKVKEIRGMIGTNMTFHREVFEKVGLFDERLGAGAAGFSEDTDYSQRIRQAGYKIGYCPEAIVYQLLDPAKYGEAYHRQVHFRKGLSRSIYQRHSIFFNVLPNLFINCVRYALYRALRNEAKAYETVGRIMKYWGYLVGSVQKKMSKHKWA